jgi:hypothetical protein
MLWSGQIPLIVPFGADQTIYLVVESLGLEGFSRETVSERTDFEVIIADLISGQFNNPIGILAINTLEHWVDDVSKDVSREIQCRCDIDGVNVPDYLDDFVCNSISRTRS